MKKTRWKKPSKKAMDEMIEFLTTLPNKISTDLVFSLRPPYNIWYRITPEQFNRSKK
jgi:hypothetical protein